METTNVNASTVKSTSMASRRGMFPGFTTRTAESIALATNKPAAPPMSPSITLSVSSWRSNRCQFAPSANRTAISF